MYTLRYYAFPQLSVNKEKIGILLSLILFLSFPWLSRHWDITSAAIDCGALSAVIMAVFTQLVFKAVTWRLIKAIWPVLANYSEFHFENNFKSLAPCVKVVIYLSFYLLLLLSFVFTLAAVI